MANKRINWMIFLVVFLTITTQFFGIKKVNAVNSTRENQQTIESPELYMETNVEKVNDQYTWHVFFNKKKQEKSNEYQMKFKIKSDGEHVEYNSELHFDSNFYKGDLSLIEVNSSEPDGSVDFITDNPNISIEIQMDHKNIESESINKDILKKNIEGPHYLTFNDIDNIKEQITFQKENKKTNKMEINNLRTIQDPFEYQNNQLGNYINHSTNQYIGGLTNQQLINFNFGFENTEGNQKVTNVINKGTGFDRGYHDYGNALLKKTVMPSNEENQFKIQLDLLSGVEIEKKPLDIVLVLDKSSSMKNNNRNNNMIAAVEEFTKELFEEKDGDNIRVALANYWGMPESERGTTKEIQSEVSKFKNGAFSSDPKEINSSKVLTRDPVSGTPITMGLKAGSDVLYNTDFDYGARPEAEKIMVVLTDGAPYTAIKEKRNDHKVQVNEKSKDHYVLTYSQKSYENKDRFYENKGSQEVADATVHYSNKLKSDYPDISVYSIGFGIKGVTNAINTMERIASSADKFYLADDGTSEIVEVFKDIAISFTRPLLNAEVIDPMSQYVDYKGNLKSYALMVKDGDIKVISPNAANFPKYAKNIITEENDSELHLSNITMGNSLKQLDGYRIEYEVELKPEYKDGKFYPTNGSTYVFNKRKDYYHYAVPSIKHPVSQMSIPFEKKWIDDENQWNLRKDISFQLQRKNNQGIWTDVPGQLKNIKKESSGENLKGQFEKVPIEEFGKLISYRIIEISDGKQHVYGYSNPKISKDSVDGSMKDKNIVITNKLLTTDLMLEKVNEANQVIPGVEFTLFRKNPEEQLIDKITSDQQGKINFLNLPVGNYVLKETKPALGYKKHKEITFEIVEKEMNKLSIEGLPKDNKIVNELEDFNLTVEKIDNFNRPVSNVIFKLSGKNFLGESYEVEKESDNPNSNIFTFKNLRPGNYQLEETLSPNEYVGLEKPISVVITKEGIVTVDGEEQSKVITEMGNNISIQVVNQRKGILPHTGGTKNPIRRNLIYAISLLVLILGVFYLYYNRKEKLV